jgi:O-6-methylguanine DNA methyltransferase
MKFLCKTRLGDFLAEFEDDFVIRLSFPGDFAKPFGKIPYISSELEEFDIELNNYLNGLKKSIDFPYKLKNVTEFQKNILELLKEKITFGKTCTYYELGMLYKNKCARSIGQVMKKNPLPLIFPCHRVLNKNKKTNNYSPGVFYKDILLKLESNYKEDNW